MNPLAWISNKLMHGPSCKDVNEFLAEYVEGVLDEDTRRKFERHIKNCKCCGPYLIDYLSTIEMAKSSQEIVVPDELSERTIAFLRTRLSDA